MQDNQDVLATALEGLRSRLQAKAGETVTVQNIPTPPALQYLSDCFQLSPLEQGILLLCVALELDPAMSHLCARLQGDATKIYPTFSLAFNVFDEPSWAAMSSEHPLRYWRLLEVLTSGSLPLMLSPLKIDDRILNFITGSNRLDHRLASLLFPLSASRKKPQLSPLSPSQQHIAQEICQILQHRQLGASLPIIQLLGSDAGAKRQIARDVVATFGRSLYGLMGELIPAANSEFAEFMRLWEREEHLLALALYIDTQEVMSGSTSGVVLRRFLSQNRGLLFLDSRVTSLPPNRDAIAITVEKPTPTEQRHAWETVLNADQGESPLILSSQFNLNFGEIEDIATVQGEETPQTQKLWNTCLQRTQPRLDNLAQRLTVKATWDHLVLPEEEVGLLQQIVQQVRLRGQVYDQWGFRDRLNRGLGTAALFAGESGTGKTMAAEVIAKELNLHLYRIDLSSVVNKYIGETEKNLRRLFDAAEEGGAILFFDEADSLFGKRSEVKDSHDRYANLEINYLLQRIEAYRGLAILATNLKDAVDQAFLRRLRFIIDFPFPSAEYRQQLWRKVFPPQLPLGTLDYAHLGRLNLTGGAIYNIAINAAFMAAEQGKALEMEHILSAVRAEYKKLGRPIYEAELQWDGVV
ncbi:MAG: ATP-binding protein, partial [Kamptonema sp. SIO4C4]|nr:ATP-binding protein [Kamptonema sp. SIO4C4]